MGNISINICMVLILLDGDMFASHYNSTSKRFVQVVLNFVGQMNAVPTLSTSSRKMAFACCALVLYDVM